LQLTNISTLILYECRFSKYPEEISSLKKLTNNTMHLAPFIPEGISKITNLRGLELIGIKNAIIPQEDRQLYELKMIRVEACNPTGMSDFANINYAWLNDVDFRVFQDEICGWGKLERLIFDVANIDSLPPCLANFTRLEELVLFSTSLTKLPDFINEMESLKYLEIEYGRITSIPQNLYKNPYLDRLIIKGGVISSENLLHFHNSNIDTIVIRQSDFKFSKP